MFLAIFDKMDVPSIIENGLRTLCGWLCKVIYPGISSLYQLFLDIGTLTFERDFTTIYNKISLIIGIFMVFRVIFWLIEILVNPDYIGDKEKKPSKIVQKVLVSVVMLALTPKIFNYAFRIQYMIVSEHIIEQIIEPGINRESAEDVGNYISASLFKNFYTINSVEGKNASEECTRMASTDDNVEGSLYKSLLYDSNLGELNNECLTKRYGKGKNDAYEINFNGLFAVGVGAVVMWMILMYCISLGARYAQLIFLQIIAPIPIMCYLTPNKDNMFTKWIKQCTTTYLDLFIRIAIISLVLYLSTELLNNDSGILTHLPTDAQKGYIQIFLVLGLLIFAKKAPDLIQELLPKGLTKASGDFGLSLKKRTDSMLFGKPISKGYDKAVGFLGKGAKATALAPLTMTKRLAKNTITGIDSAAHGKGFWNGFNKNPGKLRQWYYKQLENLTPETYKAHKARVEGKEQVSEINSNWNYGVKLAEKLKNAGVEDWKGALDGVTEDNYRIIFKHKKFIDSKIAVDRASKNEESFRYAQQAIDMGAKSVTVAQINPEDGKLKQTTYNLLNEADRTKFSKDLETSQKILKGAETVHTEISKQYQDDATTEKRFKNIKNNVVNPTNQTETHETRGIGKKETENKNEPQTESKTQVNATPENKTPLDYNSIAAEIRANAENNKNIASETTQNNNNPPKENEKTNNQQDEKENTSNMQNQV